jgi:hypothetical protein
MAELDRATARVSAGPASACLGFIADPIPFGLSPVGSNNGPATTYLVVGEFDRMTPAQRATLPAKAPPGFSIKYFELADPIPSADAVPELTRQLMELTDGRDSPPNKIIQSDLHRARQERQ